MRSSARVLVVAKAPVAGLAKTRLGADVGMTAAADLAAAALLDTLASCRGFGTRYLALSGDLGAARRGEEILEELSGWVVFEQRGGSFGERLAHAHARVAADGPGPVVQIGMDTPQVSAALLADVVDRLDAGADVVLGAAEDGGWWVLGLADGSRAAVLVDVEMSTPTTFRDTVEAFAGSGLVVGSVATLRDVDTVPDAEAVAAGAPATEFGLAWNARYWSPPRVGAR